VCVCAGERGWGGVGGGGKEERGSLCKFKLSVDFVLKMDTLKIM
jgi:hypothetical protein